MNETRRLYPESHTTVRVAIDADAAAIARLVNAAYLVERSFVEGDRTNPAEVRRLCRTGTFLVTPASGDIVGCVHLEMGDGGASFGLLAVESACQRRGTGRALIAMAEDRARAAGCRAMTIRVVNLRTELLAFYARLGYCATGTAAYVHRPVTRACHFVVMTKTL
jgi:N-acetylglutamate synthase-like GNAT family acetyltransferase